MSTNDHAFGSLAEILPGIIVDCFGLPQQPVREYFLTHYHYDHAAYGRNFPRGLTVHLNQAKNFGALELVAPPTIINRYRQIGLNPVWGADEDKKRLELPHPDRNNGRHGITLKATSYVINKIFWIAETDSKNLLGEKVDNFLRRSEAGKKVEWVAVPPPDETHFLSRQSVDDFVSKICGLGKKPFTYAHAFQGTEKWRSVTKSTDAETGIGVSSAPPIGVLMLPQVTETFQDVLGGRYSAPRTIK